MGREQVAREIYEHSSRTQKPIIVIEAGGALHIGKHDPKSDWVFQLGIKLVTDFVVVHSETVYHISKKCTTCVPPTRITDFDGMLLCAVSLLGEFSTK